MKWLAIDSDLHRRFKARTAAEGKQMKDVIETLIEEYLKNAV